MPEGPELRIASRFVNAVCRDRVFTGKVIKSDVSKSEDVLFSEKAYTITSSSRGKEMQLFLTKAADTKVKNDEKGIKAALSKSTRILFRFGMSGKFAFTDADEVHKHAHLKFFTNDKSPMVLSFVDVRRFGRWEVNADWSDKRGPDPMFDYQAFRSNVVKNVSKVVFNRPICEVLLDQKYFNGIGNYLRAEILYRAGIPPFTKARTVLEGLPETPPDTKVKSNMDVLHLCHVVPLEVINLKGSVGFNPDGRALDYDVFEKWLQCYYQPGMNNVVDSNGRTIWFQGAAGPMVPKGAKTRGMKTSKKRKSESKTVDTKEETTEESNIPETKKSKTSAATTGKKMKTNKKGKPPLKPTQPRITRGSLKKIDTVSKNQTPGKTRRSKTKMAADTKKSAQKKATKKVSDSTKPTPVRKTQGKRTAGRGQKQITNTPNEKRSTRRKR
ncbi:endonuclease 8-like 1 [Glandiceps talaboti]